MIHVLSLLLSPASRWIDAWMNMPQIRLYSSPRANHQDCALLKNYFMGKIDFWNEFLSFLLAIAQKHDKTVRKVAYWSCTLKET